jgi:hypothetical protein
MTMKQRETLRPKEIDMGIKGDMISYDFHDFITNFYDLLLQWIWVLFMVLHDITAFLFLQHSYSIFRVVPVLVASKGSVT